MRGEWLTGDGAGADFSLSNGDGYATEAGGDGWGGYSDPVAGRDGDGDGEIPGGNGPGRWD